MKITKHQLKIIIKEAIEAPGGDSPKDIAKELLALEKEISEEMIEDAVAAAGILDDDIPDFVDAVAVEIENISENKMRITKTKLVEIIKEELGGAMAEIDATAGRGSNVHSAAMAEIDATAGLLATIRDKLVHLDRTVLHDSTGATAEELSSRLDEAAEAIDEVVVMIDKWEEEDIDEYY